MANPKECGADMGGIWIPHPNRGENIYLPLRCNKAEHGAVTDHAFLDPKGGMLVQRVVKPRVVVTKDRIGPPS